MGMREGGTMSSLRGFLLYPRPSLPYPAFLLCPTPLSSPQAIRGGVRGGRPHLGLKHPGFRNQLPATNQNETYAGARASYFAKLLCILHRLLPSTLRPEKAVSGVRFSHSSSRGETQLGNGWEGTRAVW